MKNSIFIGPYRQNNINGKWSRSLLEYIIKNKKQNSVTARPIYVEKSKTEECSEEIIIAELLNEDKYDILIQNNYLDGIISIPKLKNYVIPITTNEKIDQQQIESLSQCDKIIVDNLFDYKIFANLFPEKTYLFDYDVENLDLSSDKKIEMGIYNHMQKIYFIGSYESNKNLVETLINVSILINKYRENVCMVFFLTDQENNPVKKLKEYSDNIYKELNINNIVTKNIFLNANFDIDNLMMFHNSCDILLNINEDSHNSFNSQCAKKVNNFVLELQDLEVYLTFNRNDKVYGNGYYAPLESELIRAINKAASYQKEKIVSEKTSLENLIWN